MGAEERIGIAVGLTVGLALGLLVLAALFRKKFWTSPLTNGRSGHGEWRLNTAFSR